MESMKRELFESFIFVPRSDTGAPR
jgi:hypothetical protein